MSPELLTKRFREQVPGLSPCEHRAVSKSGRIVCSKIVEGDACVAPNTCRVCPFKAANCAHLRFSLRQTTATPLIVRYNGRTEFWDDDAPALRFEQAACSARLVPITHPRQCAGCALRQPVATGSNAAESPASVPRRRMPRAGVCGRVVPFPSPDRVRVAG